VFLPQLPLIAHAVAALAFAALSALLAFGWRRGGPGIAFVAAALLTHGWLALEAAAAFAPAIPDAVPATAELLRTGGWLALLAVLLALLGPEGRGLWRHPSVLAGGALLLAGLAAEVAGPGRAGAGQAIAGQAVAGWLASAGLLVRLGLAVVGLVLVENLFRRTSASARWSFKHLLIGLGTLFAFDLFLYSEALLFRAVDPTTALARPLVNALVVPLLLVGAARVRPLSLDVQVSREAAFHTSALVGSGLYLVGVAGVGYVLRETSLGLGPLVQLLFLVGAGVLLAVLLLSGEVRARARVLISRHFFSFAYDYRREWLRFIAAMTEGAAAPGAPGRAEGAPDLYERAVASVAEVFECGGGALFLRDRAGGYGLAARWQWPGSASLSSLPRPLAERLDRRRQVLDLRLGIDLAGDDAEAAVLAWLRRLDAPWLLVPVPVRGDLAGAILLVHPRAPRALTWEDEDMLAILGVQVGSYVAEEQVTRDLAQARRFERMSQHFTFVAHDLKNLVTQLSLIVQQAERHGDKPEFQRDAMATVGQSVEKMRAMLVRLKDASAAEPSLCRVPIADLLARARHPRLEPGSVTLRARPDARVAVEPEGFQGVLDNLVHNAAEAGGRVRVSGGVEGAEAVVEVSDDGPGMSERFVAEDLFRPFASTKEQGFGVGMFQARALVEGWGGRLEVDSREGRGTTVRIRLPLAEARADAEGVVTA
jgi:putative PEP-CTERM system histidine kinase